MSCSFVKKALIFPIGSFPQQQSEDAKMPTSPRKQLTNNKIHREIVQQKDEKSEAGRQGKQAAVAIPLIGAVNAFVVG